MKRETTERKTLLVCELQKVPDRFGGAAEFFRQIEAGFGAAKRDPEEQRDPVSKRNELVHLGDGLSTTNVVQPYSNESTMSFMRLMGCVWIARDGGTPASRQTLDLPTAANIEGRAFVSEGRDDCRVWQCFHRVVDLYAR